ncbi:protein FAM237A-like [Heptranchias perlo]|uniref:protein FAM237A-like n=1 Tax=Heptranchias perlo TaxID=212740 RepID=UPI00355958F1
MGLTSKRRLVWNHSLMGTLFLVGLLFPPLYSCHGQIDPLALGRADPQCWESSSALLLEMRKPRIADTVSGFWDFMIYLKSSDESKHAVLFWVLAQLFWDIYVDCMISRTHGLGRRRFIEDDQELTALHAQISGRSFVDGQKVNDPKEKEFVQDWVGIQVYRSGPGIMQSRIAKNMGFKRASTI